MEKTPETSEVSIIEKLNANNLPELIGWQEKQETLLKENPYVEIQDTKTYDLACKSRTNLLKGRTELEKQDKAIASKVAAFRKEVGAKTQELIEITLSAEQNQQTEVKRWEGIKEAEKAEKERLENERIDSIKNMVNELETLSFQVIQKMTYAGIVSDSARVSEIMETEFNFEEFDILFTNAFSRVKSALDEKVKDLTERESERLENIRLQEENAESKRKSDLQASRLNEILPYVAFGSPIDLTKLSEMDDDEYNDNLSSKKGLFEANQELENKRKEKEESDKKEQEEKLRNEKEAILEIKKKRLEEIGFNWAPFQGFSNPIFPQIKVDVKDVYNSDTIEFENILSDAKKSISDAKEQSEKEQSQKLADEELAKADAAKLKKENANRVKRLKSDIEAGINILKSIDFPDVVYNNKEVSDFMVSASERFDNLKVELIQELKNI